MNNKESRAVLDSLITRKVDSPNKELRKPGLQWGFVLNHHTGVGDRSGKTVQSTPGLLDKLFEGTASWFLSKTSYVSAHYNIDQDGEIIQFVDPDTHVAWHAGISSYWNPQTRKIESGCNQFMIGIEHNGDGNKLPYSKVQLEKSAKLSAILSIRFPSIQLGSIGHEMITSRKNDPGAFWPYNSHQEQVIYYRNKLLRYGSFESGPNLVQP